MHIAVCDDQPDELAAITSIIEEWRIQHDSAVRLRAFASADDMLERLTIYAPAGGSIAYVDHNDNFIPWADGSYKGLQVATGQVHNQIDHPAIINFTVTTSPEAAEDLTVRITPTVQDYR